MLAILTTHPIQYQVPLWQALARDGRVPFEVWYLTKHAAETSGDREFGKSFAWDLDMLAGYPHRFLDVDPDATPNDFWKCRLREPLAERMRKAGVKALWIQGWQVAAYWQAVWTAKKAGAEVWLRGESNDLAPTPFWKRLVKRVVLDQLFRRVDRFLYIGIANRRLYEKFGVPAERLYPAPYAVDNERFRRQAESLRGQRSEIRSHWKIPEDAFCVLFCGKFIPKKRPMDLVKAAELLTSRSGSRTQPPQT
jgi:glycosyltransferase involved in cell wall biosynthesis